MNSSSLQSPASSLASARPALFFDRDGTLMKEVDHCHRPEDVHAIEGAAELLGKTHAHGWLHLIITNQSGIGRGYFTKTEFDSVQEELQRQLNGLIDDVYMSPDMPGSNSTRRKPAPGMILEAAEKFNIDLPHSFMIGDRTSDIEAGRAAGCRTILVLTGYGKEHRDCGADFIAEDVTEALEIILRLPSPPKPLGT
ncbi:MAG: HAD family hydrolase [Chthoniobacterales bacterium]|nr:HAD family hydrolase [Chthoniobacterales bacterium]